MGDIKNAYKILWNTCRADVTQKTQA